MKNLSRKKSIFLNRASKQSLKISVITLTILLATACSGDSEKNDGDDSFSVAGNDSFPLAGSETGVYSIDASGGNGNSLTGGRGGYGSYITVLLKDGMDGRLEILNYGKVNASFATPSISTNTGTSGEAISADTTVNVTATEPAADVLYMVSDDTNLYKSDGNGTIAETDEIISGLTIDANTTLTLALNMNSPAARLEFTDDIVNNGTITTAADGTAKGDLMLWAKNIVTSSGSTITTAGADTIVVNGGAISLQSDRVISNAGTVNSSGYTDSNSAIDGGDAGNITMTSIENTYNNGTLSAIGGAANGANNNGGNGGAILLTTQYGDLNSAGAINADGGNADVTPGDGGAVTLNVSNMGDLRNAANVTTMGGNSATDSGGNAGVIIIQANGGGIKTNGNLTSTGGTAADNGMTGGNGGNIRIRTDWGSFESAPGNILISGNLNMKGGDIIEDVIGGGTGGMGGNINITGNYNNGFATPQLIGLWGYTSIISNGGDGEGGQNGGALRLHTEATQTIASDGSYEIRDASDIINYANITLKGGNSTSTIATNKSGGMGGIVHVYGKSSYPNNHESSHDLSVGFIGGEQTIFNAGNIIASSGNNYQYTSSYLVRSGPIVMRASGNITNTGSLTTDGGNDAGTTLGIANNGGDITFTVTNGIINNSGAISALGGNGALAGGAGGDISFVAKSIINTANFTTSGGNAEVAVTSSIGGDAGEISFTAISSARVSDSGIHIHNGGTGETAGNDPVVHSLTPH